MDRPVDPNLNRVLANLDPEPEGTRRSRVDSTLIVRGSPPRQPSDQSVGPRPSESSSTSRQCWICFATDEDERGMAWVQPCKCRGTTKWVHQVCLQQWIDEKLKEDRDKIVHCPQCRARYLIYFPKSNFIVKILDSCFYISHKLCPTIVGCYAIGSIYWAALSYGTIIVAQVGGDQAQALLLDMKPSLFLIALPLVPVAVISLVMLRWEEALLNGMRWTSQTIPLTGYVLPNQMPNESEAPTDRFISEGMSCTRVFAGAVVLPLAAKICGDLLFSNVQSPYVRAAYGALTFSAVKGVIIMYHKQQTYKRLSRRRILDYTEENKIQVAANRQTSHSPQ